MAGCVLQLYDWELAVLLMGMLRENPSERLTPAQALRSPFVTAINATARYFTFSRQASPIEWEAVVRPQYST